MKTLVSIWNAMKERYRPHALVALALFGVVTLSLLWHGYSIAPLNLLFIHDEAHVLDQPLVIQAANGVGYNIDIFTLDGNTGDLAAFSRTHVSTPQAGTVVIVIDTRARRLALQGNGSAPYNPVRFTAAQYQLAQRASLASMDRGDFTAATVAALQSLSKAAASIRFLSTLPWLVGFLLDLVLVSLSMGLLLLPRRAHREKASPLSDQRPTSLV